MKLKNLNKRIRRLVTRIGKDTKKLTKLQRKATASKGREKRKPDPRRKTKPSKSVAAVPKKKKKRRLSPETRAKMAAMMKERWAAKRARAATGTESSSGSEPDVAPAA